MSVITPKQNAFKFKIAPHKQKSTVKKIIGRKMCCGIWMVLLKKSWKEANIFRK